ncbi:MAG: flagellar filament capping protein FliD [Burkholderiaceae bacterium]|nr:flagellar filament capping protein FliD [Burkholderiaceae bacterium]MEB2352466.1 flagellar filament capping protein FliD [Burkholderiaceae bacterium]
MTPIGSSSIDVNGIVSQLMQIEQRPLQALKKTVSGIETRLSAFGKLQSALASMQDAARTLTRADTWRAATATSSDETTLRATAGTGVIPGGYTVEVGQLAQRQSLASHRFADSAAVIGGGTLRIRMGTLDAAGTAFTPDAARPEVAVAIAAGATLAEVRNAINAAGPDIGITASLVADGTGQRLMLRSAGSGAPEAFAVAVDDADGGNGDASGLSALAFDPAAASGSGRNLQLTQAAQDAHVTINGLEVTSTTNRLTDVIENLTLELRRTTTAPIDVSVDSDTAALRKSLDGFVEAWNAVNTLIADQVRFDPATKTAGVLQGNQTVVRVQQQLREILRSTVGTDAPNSLSALGVELQRDGSLKVDDTRAGAALADPKKAQAFFAAQGTTPGEPGGMARRVLASLDALLASDGAISGATESLRARERSVAQQEERLNARLNEIEKRLLRQYTALDANLTRMAGSLSSVQNLLAGLERPA